MIICVQEDLKKSEDRVGQSVQEKATITNSLNETLVKLQSEQSIVKDKEGRLVELQMSLESAQKSFIKVSLRLFVMVAFS